MCIYIYIYIHCVCMISANNELLCITYCPILMCMYTYIYIYRDV